MVIVLIEINRLNVYQSNVILVALMVFIML